MKFKSLPSFVATVGLFFGSTSMFALDIDPPTMPEGRQPEDGAVVMLYNVENELCMGNGKISAPWATSTILMENGGGLMFKLLQQGDGSWSLQTASGEHSGKYTFTPTAEGDRPFCYIDMQGDWQGCRTWNIGELEDGIYTLALTDTELAPEGTYLGTDGYTLDVRCNADPDDGGCVQWLFLEADGMQLYQTRIQFYEALCEGEIHPSIDLTPFVDAYNNSDITLEEMTKSLNALKAAIAAAMIAEDDIDPSPEDPLDVTLMYMENPTFDSDVNGWQNINGMTKDPNSTPYGDIQDFCEKWAWDAPLGREYGIYQTLSLAPGLYRVEADAIACAQYDGSINVSGVKFYVKNEGSYEVAVATANNSPKHYVIEFTVDGSTPTEIGFHCDATTEANWIACDNFSLWYMGKTDMSQALIQLKNIVATASNLYPIETLPELRAQESVKNAYEQALSAANELLENPSTDAAYESATNALATALEAFKTSNGYYAALQNLSTRFMNLSTGLYEIDTVGDMEEAPSDYAQEIDLIIEDGAVVGDSELAQYTEIYNAYNAMYDLFNYCIERKNSLESDELIGMVEEKEAELHAAWVGKSYTTVAQVQAARDEIDKMIAEYLNANIQPDSDLTSMLTNANFDENTNGWNYNGLATPGYSYQCAEYFQKNFNVSQTLKSMPKGRYTLTCQAYQRRSTVNAVLYANENELLIYNVKDFAQEPGYFSEADGYPHDSYDAAVGYYPNSMEGARNWFDATDDDGEPLYTNKLDFFLTEDATDLTIGIRSDDNGDWCLFDNFQLYYHGNRAEDYAGALQDIMDQIDELVAEGFPTAKLVDDIAAAKKTANEAIASGDGNACIAAIPTLNDALAETRATLALMNQLADKYNFSVEYRLDDVTSSKKGELETYLQGIAGKMSDAGVKNDDEIKTLCDEIDAKFTQCIQADAAAATEANPFDMTGAIINPTYECWFAANDEVAGSEYNAFGWSWDGVAPNCNEYSAEVWNQKMHVYQSIKGLAPGYYKLHVQGYHRKGHGNDKVDEDVSHATLYAGSYSTRLLDILSYAQPEPLYYGDEGEEGTVEIDGETMYFPQNMPQTLPYFEEGLYMNTLIFKIEEGQKDITIGIIKDTLYDWDSTMFDNWSLEYVGTNKPTEESTKIDGVAFGDVKSTIVYTTTGIQTAKLQKGINIIKSVDNNGNVRINKILVK